MEERSDLPSKPGKGRRLARRVVAVLFFAIGLAVFLVRLHHAGPYAFPADGNLRAALLALALGVWFSRSAAPGPGPRRWLDLGILALSPIVLFFAFYATLAELEEVVVLKATDAEGKPSSLRLWVMDDAGFEWVNMPREKALANDLASQRVEWLRDGSWSCREATLVDERTTVARNSRLGAEKYAVKRFAQAIGVFSKEIPPGLVSIRLAPCADRPSDPAAR